MSQGGSNAPLLAALGTSAYREFSRKGPGWTLQHRHPDGQAWLVIGYFPTKELAREAANAFVAADYGPAEDFRVQRSKAPADRPRDHPAPRPRLGIGPGCLLPGDLR